jgi:HK97 gp10 family phage protein
VADIVGIKGLAELENTLKQFPGEIRKKPIMDALFAGAAPIVTEARILVPRDTGNLAAKIKAFKARRSNYAAEVDIGVVGTGKAARDEKGKKIRKGLGRSTYYWKFLEFGHRTRGSKQRSRLQEIAAHGDTLVPAKPFLRPAFDTKKEEAVSRFVQSLTASVETIRQKLVKT